ncbi:unnamed protein product [Rotaria socialis]|uniref:RING-type domain-containing protein n=1 Tax=Rotaria socialis TaxID=392032 RepID=A0A817TXC7_9BILA|nr:unnamed protein product [Rotaria socialis]CAF3318535.1 unnamed protein product [Rotaria socialis]CAF3333473.1 unnamed protein product [Rotaria socialis]CAF3442054.1 unnamed protein product [Rotaria socialis]CAF3485875.1 unnamed protein product [Rotaria socialis]
MNYVISRSHSFASVIDKPVFHCNDYHSYPYSLFPIQIPTDERHANRPSIISSCKDNKHVFDKLSINCSLKSCPGYICCQDKRNTIHIKVVYSANKDSAKITEDTINPNGELQCGPSKQHEYYILTLRINLKTKKFNLTCTTGFNLIEPNDSDKYPLSKTSLFGIIVLAACTAFALFLCIGWFIFTYYRQYKRRQIKIKLQKALANSVQQILDKTPIVTFISTNKTKNSNSEDPMCAICLESFIDNEKTRKLICSHYFHTGCIDPWLLSNQNCPLCNRNILNDYVPSISDTIKSNRRETLNQQSRSTNTVNNRQSNPIIVNEVLNS